MRKVQFLLVAALLLPTLAAAQGPAGVGAGSGSSTRSRSSSSNSGSEDNNWQLAIGYQYNRLNLTGIPFTTQGINTTLTRYFGRWFGVDAQLGAGFRGNTGTASTPPNLGVHSFFVGAGPRLAFRGPSRIQPWVHLTVGLEDFRFTQTAGLYGNNKALGGAAGGGVDVPLTPHFSFRVEADVLGTRFYSTNQRHFQAVSGVVFNF